MAARSYATLQGASCLVEIQDGGDTVVEYEYDGPGRRIRKTQDLPPL